MNDDPFSPDQPAPTPPFAVRPVGTGTPTGPRPPRSPANRPKRRHAAGRARKVTGAASLLAFGGLAGVIGISAHQASTAKSTTVATTAATGSSDDGTTASTTASTASASSSAATTATTTPSTTATTTPTTQAATSSHGS